MCLQWPSGVCFLDIDWSNGPFFEDDRHKTAALFCTLHLTLFLGLGELFNMAWGINFQDGTIMLILVSFFFVSPFGKRVFYEEILSY